ncbi:MAG: hypothetical protein IJU47_04365 [Verrucomicrobia bacterium]|nr:hypothetical protein [Verrucomicrobiota bacterium]
MKKQILAFGVFCLGLLTSLWVCAQSETTTAEKTEKTPGEQLLEFMMNPPEKYDVGGYVEYLLGEKRTNYFRMLRDGDFSLFEGDGTNSEIISSEGLCDLKKYNSIFSKCNEYYYSLGAGTFTTWTNNEKQPLENELLKQYRSKIETQKNELFPLSFILKYSKFLDKNHLDISTPNAGSGSAFLERDSDGRIIRFAFLEKSDKNKGDTSSEYSSGLEYLLEYTRNVGPDFYPSAMKMGLIHNEKNQLITNHYSIYHFHHLTLDPHFEKSYFTIEPSKDMPLKRYWIAGTNTVFFDTNTGTLDRVYSYEELAKEKSMQAPPQSKYRGIYITLLVVALVGGCLLIARKLGKKG